MKIAITYDSTNAIDPKTGDEKNDADGAFIPQSSIGWQIRRKLGDVCTRTPCNSVVSTTKAIAAMPGLDAWWYFGHGTRSGLPSIGAHSTPDAAALGALLSKQRATPRIFVALWACSAGAMVNGFASKLRDALERGGATHGWVDSHSTAQHTTRNRDVVRWYIGEDRKRASKPIAGATIGAGCDDFHGVITGDDWTEWERRLKAKPEDDRAAELFRFTWPFLTVEEIRADLAKGRAR